MKKTFLIIAGSALVTGVAIRAAPALSQPAGSSAEMNVSIVRTADLDLSSNDGQRLLDRRLVIAASTVCGTASDFDLKGKNQVRECRGEVLTKARARARTIVAAERGDAIAVSAQR